MVCQGLSREKQVWVSMGRGDLGPKGDEEAIHEGGYLCNGSLSLNGGCPYGEKGRCNSDGRLIISEGLIK